MNKRLLRLKSCLSSLMDSDTSVNDIQESNVSDENDADNIMQGDTIGGRVQKILPGVGGLLVQIGPYRYGNVHYTELADTWVPHPLSGYEEGKFVKCKVLEKSRSSEGLLHYDLSLRPSLVGVQSTSSSDTMDSLFERVKNVDGLHPGMEVKGYVKNVTSKGCFVTLSRKVDARIFLSNLSNDYVAAPEKEFPVGLLVHGRVLSVDPSLERVDVTLKKDIDTSSFSNVKVGEVVSGLIRRIEPYGLFIKIDHIDMVGLCHISELSDEHLDNIEDRYKAGDRVVVKILKVDEERRRIALGMKRSYIADTNDVQDSDDIDDSAAVSNSLPKSQQNESTQMIVDQEDETHAVISQAESRSTVLPLEVLLDESEDSGMDDDASVKQNHTDDNLVAKKNNRREKRKAKEERELEIRAAEERILQNDIPQTEEEFEKLVRSSPNDSFVWVQYMAHMVTLTDVEKARSVAERALQTINFREENEKLNIWTAYLNLENQYGNPPEEAVRKIFQRALQYCDPKRVHMALLGVYERTEQHKLGDELLERMTKKFKTSCKIWLRRVQSLLMQGKEGIQSIVNHALLSLPPKKRIKFISQTAILEFKCGVPDRGRSMFEGILREFPKRTDLWSVYLDQEIRLGDSQVIRALFERVTCLSLPPRKIKSLFKKYLDYEKSQGDEERVEHVKRKAIEYAESFK